MPIFYLTTNATTFSNPITTPTTGLVLQNQIFIPTTASTATALYYPSNSIITTTSLHPSLTGATYVYYTDTSANFNRSQLYQALKAKKGPLIKKSIRSSIKKAVRLISNFGMEDDLKIFLGGDTIEMSHPDSDFKFLITKRSHSLIKYTEHCVSHTPYQLELYTKTDIFVADLCVYYKSTPLLDQLLATSMFIKTGNEEDLLVKANYNRLTRDKDLRKSLALNNPLLRSKLRADFVDI
jgi:hypothetical protein